MFATVFRSQTKKPRPPVIRAAASFDGLNSRAILPLRLLRREGCEARFLGTQDSGGKPARWHWPASFVNYAVQCSITCAWTQPQLSVLLCFSSGCIVRPRTADCQPQRRHSPARLPIAAEGSEAGAQIPFNAARDVDDRSGRQEGPRRRRAGFRPPDLDGLSIPPAGSDARAPPQPATGHDQHLYISSFPCRIIVHYKKSPYRNLTLSDGCV